MMYCPKCGTPNEDNTYACTRCGTVLRQAGAAPPLRIPPNYLVPAILATILCCLPFGIVSIVYASQVNTKAQAGDMAGALESSKNARMWLWLSVAAALAAGAIYVALMVMGIVAGL